MLLAETTVVFFSKHLIAFTKHYGKRFFGTLLTVPSHPLLLE
jgi:hypothetical protein